MMSHTIELTDEQDAILRDAAGARGESPDIVVASFIAELHARRSKAPYYETDDFLRHMGATEAEINELNRKIAEENKRVASTHDFYETEEWFRYLGMTAEQIAEPARLAAEADDADA